ncbi:hypothetical protein EI94DRAFT_1702383 [Lactarius quietus]|nr:hypothetical protein EI94DRAFT_1702383 [Lactarius quietus]
MQLITKDPSTRLLKRFNGRYSDRKLSHFFYSPKRFRFRILVIGRSGIGKSSLIKHIFGINITPIKDCEAGDVDIEREFQSEENKNVSFSTISKASNLEISKTSRLIHGLWLCVETPTAGGHVLETGDEKLLKLAHEKDLPIVLMFTQYDRLVKMMEFQLRESPIVNTASWHLRSMEEAQKAFETCLKLLNLKPGTPMPTYAKVSVRKGYEEQLSDLVEITGDVCKDRGKGDAWVLWSMAQRTNLLLKIDPCVIKGNTFAMKEEIDNSGLEVIQPSVLAEYEKIRRIALM